jgi:hypothetical protein
MPSPSRAWRWRHAIAAVGILVSASVLCQAQPQQCLTLESLQRMSACELATLFDRGELKQSPVGIAKGKLVYLNDWNAKFRVNMSNAVWRGKRLEEDGYFINRWIGGRERIDSHYVIGPSWVDGRPAVIMEYPPGTKLFWNMHDELREVAPGLFMGPVFERFPCPKWRGFVAFQLDTCCQPGCAPE